MRFVITDRVVNGSPVWAAVGSEGIKYGMFRSAGAGMVVATDADITDDSTSEFLQNMGGETADVMAPTELLSLQWTSFHSATLASQFASAPPAPGSAPAPAPTM
jgi:hypothetical protein